MPTFHRTLRIAAATFALSATALGGALAFNMAGRPDMPVVGYHSTAIALPDRAAPAPVHIWYPAVSDATQDPVPQAENLLFWGFHAARDATPLPGDHPVVLLSHGSGGKAVRHSWLATRLADAGYIVIGPDHPGSTSGDSDQATTLHLGLRPADLSATLDWLIDTRPLGIGANSYQVGTVGFSMGGFSALALTGAEASLPDFIDYCAEYAGELDCGWYEEANIDFASLDPATFEVARQDTRIRSVIAVDPAMPQAMNEASLAAVDVPVTILNLGQPGEVPEQFDARAVAAEIPDGTHVFIPGAVHYSFMTNCRFFGRLIIDGLGPDPICADTAPRIRAELQAEMAPMILDALNATLLETQPVQ